MNPTTILTGLKKQVELSLPLSGNDTLESRINSCLVNNYNVIVLDTFIPSILGNNNKIDPKKRKNLLHLPPPVEIPKFCQFLKMSESEIAKFNLVNQESETELSENTDPPKNKKRKMAKNLKNPEETKPSELFTSNTLNKNRKIYILRKVTIELKHPDDQHKLRKNSQNPHIGEYDIISVLPRTNELLHSACLELDCDTIVLDLPENENKLAIFEDSNEDLGSNKKPKINYLMPKRHAIVPCKKRNIFFEIRYSSLLKPKSYETNLPKFITCINNIIMNTAHCNNYKSITPNIILASQASSKQDIRSLADLQNLLDLCDLDEEKCKSIVYKHPLKVLVKAFTRKTAKGVCFVEKVVEIEKGLEEQVLEKVVDRETINVQV